MSVRHTVPVALSVFAGMALVGGVVFLLQGDPGWWTVLLLAGLVAVAVAYRINSGHLPWQRPRRRQSKRFLPPMGKESIGSRPVSVGRVGASDVGVSDRVGLGELSSGELIDTGRCVSGCVGQARPGDFI